MGTRRSVKYKGKIVEGVQVIGTTDQYIALGGLDLSNGRFFSAMESDGGRPVVVLGTDVANELFPFEDPLGKTVKVGNYTFRVVGVLDKQGSFLGLVSLDNQVILPIERFE